MNTTPIADYALLSDRRTAALVSRSGSVDWLCLPRFDSPSIFARLLDVHAGTFAVRPADSDAEITRRYLDGTMVLETTFTTATGTLVLHDALATGASDDPHQLGAAAPRMLVRSLACTAGEVEINVEFTPRPEYGIIMPLMSAVDGAVLVRGGADILLLCCPIPLDIADSDANGRCDMREGERLALGLLHRTTSEPFPEPLSADQLDAALQATVDAWRSWSQTHQSYQGPWQDLVHHSGRVLQALTYQPTWAVVAAPTTSLPEEAGGRRNWDYRYSWVRDASFTLDALWVAACPDEAEEFFDYLAVSSAAQLHVDEPLQIMFGIGGEHDLSERELGHRAGWRDSRPVRVGNGAWNQRQIDVYGELLGAAYRLVEQLDPDHPHAATGRKFLIGCADAAALRWREADAGIWEIRGEPQHFLYSKLMCWVALDRAIAMADALGACDRIEAWQATADEIREQIMTRGWSDTVSSFTRAFGSDALDASALMIPLVGFLPADDPRVLATIDTIAEGLTDSRGLVYRYRTDLDTDADGLTGHEGTFLLCTFWLAQALAASGQVARARTVFERAIGYLNDVGLLSEEVDAATGELLGNFPQALSHIGLVNAAWAIALAEESS
ncbi:glycoside hydrolase family 15 [Nocardia donostiensis]|uniref:Glycoside hydrolase family 15 n=1 Tax=Nocardia donostiensis TaxID=1538463 RepID=A0A1V2TIJ2_9NOCA|nr:glycoside hydrolase family 15 [Nocardia donostiensis]OQS14180.1 glycoside hydrolase family 15 [Nocardia donostiensis]OQS19536.1 glycoside hydrolase family 15 [Nocardia donostiensis]